MSDTNPNKPRSPETARRKFATAQTVVMHKDHAPQPPPMAATDNSPLPAQFAKHPRYHVTRKLLQDGAEAVYIGEKIGAQQRVALTVVPAELAGDEQLIQRIRDEVGTVSKLSHANILTVLGCDEAGEGPQKLQLVVSEYVEGELLSAYIKRRGPLPMEEACRYARHVANGLQYATEHGAVHGDIRPHHLLLSRLGEVKIMDFGLARVAREHAGRSLTAPPAGTQGESSGIDYLAPERAGNPGAEDVRADIYSLGCTLYQMLTAQLPFPEGTAEARLAQHAGAQPPDVHIIRPDLPTALSGVVKKMLAKKPEDRYPTPAALAAVLQFYSEHNAVSARVNEPSGPAATVRLKRAPKSSSLGWTIAAVLACAAFLAMALWKLTGTKPDAGTTAPATTSAATGDSQK